MQQRIKKVVIIGPESTGKSSLCAELATFYNTEWCTEFAREYLIENGINYNYNQLLTIAKGQLKLENDCLQKVQTLANVHQLQKPVLFIDTDMYVMKVWCEYVFNQCHPFILDAISKQTYDLYLLCNIDLPWVKDELREYPNEQPRRELYNMYKDILINQSTPWVSISGNYEQRFQTAVKAINALL